MMVRSIRSHGEKRRKPYSRTNAKSRTPALSTIPASFLSPERSLLNCEYSSDHEQLTFHIRNGSFYSISPADSSPEHFWGTIYSAEWTPPDSGNTYTCVIKASDFLLDRRGGKEDRRAEYRRPRQDFEREVRAFQLTQHKNVLKMYDFWESDGKGYIAMKKMKGSLGDVIYECEYQDIVEELRSNESILAELVREILLGLDHLHSRNIIYRDVKPDNLLVSFHPRIKLADFGNVHFLTSDDELIRGLEGTTSYMSPEMRMGGYYDAKTDIWSLGITLLNVLFDDDNFPNFDNAGRWAARKFADEQKYLSSDLKLFMQSLFLKRSDRPTARQLLEHSFVRKADKSAFKTLFRRFPPQKLALPVLSKRVKPETPPPTPEQKSTTPQPQESIQKVPPSRLTPPDTPSPSPPNKQMCQVRVTRSRSTKDKPFQEHTNVKLRTSPRRKPKIS